MPVLDQIIGAIEASIEELLREVERLRRALAALVPGTEPAGVKTSKKASSAAKRPRAATRRAPRTRTALVPPPSPVAAPGRARTAPGATKAAVLAALGDGRAMTAGEIAAATGLGRATVSSTLSKLATSGAITKAERGYQLPGEGDALAVQSAAEAGTPD
ncbi:MAG: MarR family transcriptional regulator [Solirubrobacteraceae bacterium]